MKVDFLNQYKDPYLQTAQGKGVFLAGVLLGYLALKQVEGKQSDIGKAPLFKQIQFGRLNFKTLKRHLARVPQLLAAYRENIGDSYASLTRLLAYCTDRSPNACTAWLLFLKKWDIKRYAFAGAKSA